MSQLPLPFEHTPSYHPDEFLPDVSNEEALAWLDAEWPTGRLALWGTAGCGKTHLLHRWAVRDDGAILHGPDLLCAPPPDAGRIAVDNADASPEEPLLHLLNAAAEAGVRVLLAARTAPSRWGTRLPDLTSRLRATPSVEIAAPGDDMLRDLFARLIVARQLAVPEPVQTWLLRRLPREPAALREVAERLDRAGLAAGRRVTLAIAAQVLGEIGPYQEP